MSELKEKVIQKQTISKLKNIHPPKVRWFTLENFYLPNITKKFIMSDFQRKQNAAHIRKIVESIINNTFYDNVIRCVKISNDQYEVIDGQHRLKALWVIYKNYGVTNYTIIMQLFDSADAREIFRKINSGKKLTTHDILKTYDVDNVLFFDELREYASHYRTGRNMTFLELLNCLKYSTGYTHSLKPDQLSDMLNSITPDDIGNLFRLAAATYDIYKKTLNPRVFNSALNRIGFVLGVKNNFSQKEYENYFLKILNDQKIIETCISRWSVIHKDLYKLMEAAI